MDSNQAALQAAGEANLANETVNSQSPTSKSQATTTSHAHQTTRSGSTTEEPHGAHHSVNEVSPPNPSAPLEHISEMEAPEQVQVGTAVEAMDENLDQALGHAADSIWSFASAVTGTVTSVVKDGQPGFENFRRNVTSRLAPLDTLGRDLSSQIGALAPNDASLAKFTGSMKSVAETVQRNAEAMEAAILSKANGSVADNTAHGENDGGGLTEGQNSEIALGDPAVGLLAFENQAADGGEDDQEEIDVNEEIAKVGETIQNSLIGQTVGDLWTGLWGVGNVADQDGDQRTAAVPQTRFEKRIFELQANPDTYCEPAKDLDSFEKWGKGFVLDDYAESCIAILDTHDSIVDLYERVVPRIVDEDTFWMRYFFAKHTLEKEEERRKRLLERAENAVAEGEEDDGWGDDDWGDENDNGENGNSNGSGESRTGIADSTEVNESNVTKEKPAVAKEEMNPTQKMPDSKNVSEVGTDSKLEDDWGDDDWE